MTSIIQYNLWIVKSLQQKSVRQKCMRVMSKLRLYKIPDYTNTFEQSVQIGCVTTTTLVNVTLQICFI